MPQSIFSDLRPLLIGDPIPELAWLFRPILKSFVSVIQVSTIPIVEASLADTDLFQSTPDAQVGSFDHASYFLLLGLAVFHVTAQPYSRPVRL